MTTSVATVLLAALLCCFHPLHTDPNLRTDDPTLAPLIADGRRMSPTFRELAERLQRTDVVAYLRLVDADEPGSTGRICFLSAAGHRRYLVIKIRRGLPPRGFIALVGHELRHALEIADAPQVRDQASMARLYERIGLDLGVHDGRRCFDTGAAVAAGRRVLEELGR